MRLPHIAGALALVCALAFSTTATAKRNHFSGTNANGYGTQNSAATNRSGARHSGRQISKWKRTHSHYRRYVGRSKIHVTRRQITAAQPVAIAPWSSSDVVSEARRYIGGNPTGKSSLWCAAFMNYVLERTGHSGSGSNMARSFASYGTRVSGPRVGAIAVMWRKGGGHVGIVSGIDAKGNVIVISGNHRKRVAESVYPRGRIYAYVVP